VRFDYLSRSGFLSDLGETSAISAVQLFFDLTKKPLTAEFAEKGRRDR